MHRGLLLFLWISLSAQDPNPPADTQQRGTANSISTTAPNIAPTNHELAERAHRAKYEAQCDPANEKRDSDLCAQWKAADAAVIAAEWTKWGTWFSGLSGLLVLGALFLAFQSNRIARETAKRELRAYLSVASKGVFERNAEGWTVVPLFIENHGSTPAYQTTINSWFEIVENPVRIDPREKQASERDHVPRASAVMYSPRSGEHLYVNMPFSLTSDAGDNVAASRLALVHCGVVRYKDAFKATRYTYFAHYHRGEELSDVLAKRCRFGNDAT